MELQNYEKRPAISGVQIIDLDWKFDDGGEFMELARLRPNWDEKAYDYLISFQDERLPDYKELQLNYSYMLPGVIKAFHYHKKQTDIFCFPPHQRFLVVLAKDSSESTMPDIMRITTGVKPQLIVVPPGIYHGFKAMGTEPAHMLYMCNQFFNDQDEFRERWDIFGADLWEMENG